MRVYLGALLDSVNRSVGLGNLASFSWFLGWKNMTPAKHSHFTGSVCDGREPAGAVNGDAAALRWLCRSHSELPHLKGLEEILNMRYDECHDLMGAPPWQVICGWHR